MILRRELSAILRRSAISNDGAPSRMMTMVHEPGTDRRIFVLNKHDGVLRLVVPGEG